MTSIVGNNLPVLAPLLPVTGSFALPFTAYFSVLSFRVVQCRLKDEFYVGDNSSATDSTKKTNKLFLASRCHQNFVENVPLAFALAAIAELNGANRKVLTGVMSFLLFLRIIHAELGILRPNAMGNGRPIGYFGTLGSMLGLAGYTAYLVKAYWGF